MEGMNNMVDTRNFVTCFEKPIDTQTSNDTDEFIESYLKCLDNILTEDEEYSTIVNTNYINKGENNDRTN